MPQNESKWFDWLIKLINAASQNRFYGRIALHFEAGKLVHVKREETMKPPKENGR